MMASMGDEGKAVGCVSPTALLFEHRSSQHTHTAPSHREGAGTTDPARGVTMVTDTYPELCENSSVGREKLGRSR